MIEGVGTLAGVDMVEVNLSDGNFSEPLNYQTGKYFFIKFGDSSKDETRSVKLTRHDRIMTTFYNQLLSQNERVVFIFTGKRATDQKRIVREILSQYEADISTASTNGSSSNIGDIWKTDKALLYYISMNLEYEGSANYVMNVTNVTATSEYEYNETNEIVIQSGTQIVVSMNVSTIGIEDIDDIFKFVITLKNGYWEVDQFTWNSESLFSNRQISAADGFSFHCTSKIRMANQNQTVSITWEGLQLQPKFVNVNGQLMRAFGDAYDCVGFVSPAILSGALVSFMLLFVLFIGLSCLMSIKTVDRFDNPKGKTITVTVDG